jgi:hypothetical protein
MVKPQPGNHYIFHSWEIHLPSVEEQIESMGINLLTKGSGVHDSLAAVLKQTFTNRLLNFSLESLDGLFIAIGSVTDGELDAENHKIALPILSKECKNDKRFLLSITDKKWNLLTAFTIDQFPWFTSITLDITSNASIPIRSGLFRLADFFTIQCKKHLQQFLHNLHENTNTGMHQADHLLFEKSVLNKIASFSSRVKCAMLLDEDGYVLHAVGIEGAIKELGSALANLFHRSTNELSRLNATECTSINLSDFEYTIQLGKITGTTLLIAISVSGANANVLARFLFTVAQNALLHHLHQSGIICGIPFPQPIVHLRERYSWLNPPVLVPKGVFAQKNGATTFHTPDCQLLGATDASLLQWHKTKNEALQKRLRPCAVCNP